MALRINCFACNKHCVPRGMKRLQGNFDNEETIQFALRYREELLLPYSPVNNNTRICLNCDNLIRRDISALAEDPECLRLNVLKQTRSSCCMICDDIPEQLSRLSVKARVQIFIDTNIYIPESSRLCEQHINNEGLLLKVLYGGLQSINRHLKVNGSEIGNFLQAMRKKSSKCELHFSNMDSFSDEDFKVVTSLTKPQFEELFSYCDPVRDTNVRRVKKKDLLTFLCKLHQGLSDEMLKVIFSYSSRQSVSLAINVVRRSLMLRFIPQNIGLNSINREQFCQRHVTGFANELYNNNVNVQKAIVVVDGTYAFIEKSGNYKCLRQSYSVHKGRHLVKPVLVVGTNKYILDMHGLYFANSRNNDAAILRNEFERDLNNINNWFEEGDIFIIDCGYRDVIPFLNDNGFVCQTPAILERGMRQLSTEMANRARLVTIQRWIVEACNGLIKSIFKFLNGIIPSSHVLHLREYYLIAGALLNRYHDLIFMEGKTIELARQLKARVVEVNVVQARVEAENLLRRNAVWMLLNENDIPTFPRFDLQYLKQLTEGIYQIKLTPSYIQDKLDHDNSDVFELDQNREEPGFLRIRINSRFRNTVKYQLWIAFVDNNNENIIDNNNELIFGYYCTCKSGARTIGCCAHVASVLWFLGYARHQQRIKYPSRAMLNYILDAAQRNEQDDQDLIIDVQEQ